MVCIKKQNRVFCYANITLPNIFFYFFKKKKSKEPSNKEKDELNKMTNKYF